MSKRSTKSPKTPSSPKEPPKLQPVKIVGKLIGGYYEKGELVREEIMGEVIFYRPDFKNVEKLVNEAVARAREETVSNDRA